MLKLDFRLYHKSWIAIFVILLLVSSILEDAYAVVARNYLQLQYLHALQADEGLLRVTEQISRVADGMPSDNILNRMAGVCFLAVGNTGRALEYLLRAQTATMDDPVTLYWLGQVYEQSGDYVNALLAMHRAGASQYFPVLPANMSGEELESLAQNLIDHPISAHARFELAMRVYSTNPDLAWQYFELAFQAAPDDLHYSLGAAWFYYDQGDFEAASTFGERARSLFPAAPWVYVFWGTLNRATGDFDQAIRDLEKAIELLPTGNVGNAAHLELSKIYSLREEYDVAIEHLEIANQIQEGQFSVYLQLSRAYAGLQECAVAQEKLVIASSLIETERQRDIYAHFEETVRKDCP
jgi:tetratricopeptide (TPR) repeat protein